MTDPLSNEDMVFAAIALIFHWSWTVGTTNTVVKAYMPVEENEFWEKVRIRCHVFVSFLKGHRSLNEDRRDCDSEIDSIRRAYPTNNRLRTFTETTFVYQSVCKILARGPLDELSLSRNGLAELKRHMEVKFGYGPGKYEAPEILTEMSLKFEVADAW